MHLAPANGFPPGTYEPLLSLLRPHAELLAIPPRALLPGSGPPPAGAGSWTELAGDLLAGLAFHRVPPVIGVGHSFGAVATALAALTHPAAFRGLILLDPTIFVPETLHAIRAARMRGDEARFDLVERALARRTTFGSAEEAYAYFRARALFADWPDTALGHYVAGATRERGTERELVWPREWEACYYRAVYTETWEDLPRLDALDLPILVVGGETSDAFPRDAAHLVRRLLPRATHQTIGRYGHLFPLAAPEPTARVITRWLGQIG